MIRNYFKRREVKILIIITILIILRAVFLIAGRRVDVNTDKEVDGLDQEMQEVFYLASLSPSSHNIQGWITKVDPAKGLVTIEADKTRSLDVVDPENREMYVSLGCYTETMLCAFKAYGYYAVSTYDDEHHRCVVNFSKAGKKDDKAVELIMRRHTDKNPFISGKKIEEAVVGEILKQVPDAGFYLSGSSGFDTIKTTSIKAYKKQAYNKAAAGELSKWLRLSDREAKGNKDGLPAEQLNIRGIKKVLYYLFTDHESAKGDRFAKQGVDTCSKQLEGSAGFAVVYGNNNEAAFVECGRNTVKLWLALTEQGISVHPMSYALEDQEIEPELKTSLEMDKEPQMILRIGYVKDYGENLKIRRDLADYVSVGHLIREARIE